MLRAALFALFVMVIGGARLVSLSFLLGQTSAALQVPLGVVYLALPVSGVLIVVYLTLFILERLRLLRAQLVETSRTLHERGWVANHDGNVTSRLGPGRFLSTPTAVSKGAVSGECDDDLG